MRSLLLVVAITAVGFAAGLFAGRWYERTRPIPAPPVIWGAEFHKARPPNPNRPRPPVNRKELLARIDSLRPQLEAFQKRMDEINAQFDRDLDPVLTPEQRVKHVEVMKRAMHRGPNVADTRPISDDEIARIMREQTERTVLGYVVIPMGLDWFTREYRLDDVEREKVRPLLMTRRAQFLELVDSSPPPSVALYRLSLMVERLKAPVPAAKAKHDAP